MRKKGFTLIELLSVIVILSIVALISIPIIVGVIDKARKSSAVESVNGIMDAAEKYQMSSILTGTEASTNIDLTSNTLKYKGKKPSSGTLLIDKEGNISVIAKYGNYCVEKKFGDTKPIIVDLNPCQIDASELANADSYKETILNGTYPSISGSLIPVTIDNDGTVHKANIKTKWYSYGEKIWANAVILKDESVVYNDNQVIPESNIESYFVWIPRYKYKIFNEGNYNSVSNVDSNAPHMIDIVFENKKITPSTGSKVGEYLTHPAFTSFDTNGLWVGKFETGYDGATSTSSAQINSTDSSKIIVKPDVYSWRSIQVSNSFTASYNYKRNLDSHMMKNTEWGSVTYLSHSKYGISNSVRLNNNSAYKTGYAAVKEPTCGYTATNEECNKYGTTSDVTVLYNTETGNLASTTGNITGVYDMSGGAHEYVMGVTSDTNGKPLSGLHSALNSGFNGNFSSPSGGDATILSLTTGINFPDKRYYDLYANNGSHVNYKLRILGDATGEMGPFATAKYTASNGTSQTCYINSWYDDSSYFAFYGDPWVHRGGAFGYGGVAGMFRFSNRNGSSNGDVSFRLILTNA